MTSAIRKELWFPYDPETVFHALADREALEAWMFPNDFEPKVGHRFTFRVPPKPGLEHGLLVRCEVLVCVPPHALEFTWVVDDFLDTRVRYRLERAGGGTRVHFEHEGFDRAPARMGAEYGWGEMHGALERVLERRSGR